MNKIIPIEVSARHIHISQKDIESLFGKDYILKKFKNLTQIGEFASTDKIIIKSKDRELSVRIVGPIRKETQVEISLTDAIFLGINPPIRKSGNLEKTPGVFLINSKKKININKGVIVPLRHIHCNLEEAKKLGIKNGQFVSVRIKGERGLIFDKVKVRVDKKYKLSMHIDTDEANAAGINKIGKGYLV
jgi:putative phosphotransacetylase